MKTIGTHAARARTIHKGTFVLFSLLFSIGAASCGETKECRQLKGVLKARREVLASARAQASVLDRVEKGEKAAEAEAKKVMGELGLDDPETHVKEVLEERVRAIPGATIERATTPVSTGEAGGEGGGSDAGGAEEPPVTETMWIVRFNEKDPEKAFRHLDALLSIPPITKFSTIIREKTKPGWRVEIIRAAVDQVPIKPQPVPLPKPKDLSTIPGEIGFCGAGKLRADIRAVDTEIAGLEEAVAKTSVLFPASASWGGLRGRSELLRDTELETRKNLVLFRDAVLGLRLPLKAIGVEGSMVVLEVWGTGRDRGKLEGDLVKKGVGDILQIPKVSPEGVARLMLPNAIAEARKRRVQATGPRLVPGAEGAQPAVMPKPGANPSPAGNTNVNPSPTGNPSANPTPPANPNPSPNP